MPLPPDFPLPNTRYEYRPLKKGIRGWDAYSLQASLTATGFPPQWGIDGIFGAGTDAAVRQFQNKHSLTVDGIAGILTQRRLCLEMTPYGAWPKGLDKGLYEFEGGFILGNHSYLYQNHSRDFSVVQDNLPEADREVGFDTPGRIDYYFNMLVQNYARYWKNGSNPNVLSKRRAWELAVGWWNRPAWTDRLALGLPLTTFQSEWIEAYIDRITTYAIWP